jgi:hypothetical protein
LEAGAFGTLQLRGAATATNAGAISHVSTILGECPGDMTPLACATAPVTSVAPASFTETQLVAPIDVVPGQIIQVTVLISFS